MQIGTPVLPTHQDEVRHRRGRHGKLSLPCTPNSSGRAGLPNNPRHQEFSSRKLAGNRHSLGRRHLGTLGPHHFGCFLCYDCSNNGRRPNNLDNPTGPRADGTAHHILEEDVQTYRICTSVQQALKKQIISVFEPMYLDILNDSMVGYSNISARYMLDHLFKTYGNITAVDLEINFEHMRRAWDPQQPFESLFKQIQDCADYSEAGGVLIGHPQQLNVGYAKIFATGHFMSACCRWNEKHAIEKTWTQFKSHFAAAHRQHKQMQGESAATAGYQSANAAVNHNEDQMAEANIGALANLATATAADRGIVRALTQANSCTAKQLEDNSKELRELKALLKK
jgi:hypothetical protein